ncbi:MAG: HEPN domain-containing protein [Anaerolineales bacterium]|nr:HEPN domain-containing protein [Anaerolineales bacterium]
MTEEAKYALVRNWLIKALHDLATARKLASDPDPYLDTAIFHCQQAAEKALKGFLVFHDQRFDKTHDLRTIIRLATPFDDTFSSFIEIGELLTPYAVIFRYPGDVMEPSPSEFKQAFNAAEDLYNFVLSVLPEKTYPL